MYVWFHLHGYTCYWIQPPPSLPRRGGTDTLGCLIFNGLPTSKSNLHLPFGGEREGADVCGWVISLYCGKDRTDERVDEVVVSPAYGMDRNAKDLSSPEGKDRSV